MILFGYRFYINKQKFKDKILDIIDNTFIYFGLGLLIAMLIITLPLVVLDSLLSGK